MSENDHGSFEAHKPCNCIQCAVAFGDQAESNDERLIDQLRAENAELKTDLSALEHEEGSLKLSLSIALAERDSQATLAATYKRERDAARFDATSLCHWLDEVKAERDAIRKEVREAIAQMGSEISNGTDWIGVDGDPNHALAILREALRARGGA